MTIQYWQASAKVLKIRRISIETQWPNCPHFNLIAKFFTYPIVRNPCSQNFLQQVSYIYRTKIFGLLS